MSEKKYDNKLITLAYWSGYVKVFVVLFVLKKQRKESAIWQKDVPMGMDLYEKEMTADGKVASLSDEKMMAARSIVPYLQKSRAG